MKSNTSHLFLAIILLITLIGWKNYKENSKQLIVFKQGKEYQTEWKKVDGLINIGLNKTAAEEVEKILNTAEKEKNYNQIYKANMFIAALSQSFEEESFENTILKFEKKAQKYSYPLSNIFHSALGEIYTNYYQQNRWQFANRSELAIANEADIKTWDLKTILKRVQFHYDASLQNADQLKRTPINYFEPILLNSNYLNENDKAAQPYLFDLLARRAANFYASGQATLPDPMESFVMDDSVIFATAKKFVQHTFQSSDTFSTQWKAIKIYQELIEFHKQEKNITAATEVDLMRLEFAKSYYQGEQIDQLYLNALQKLHQSLIGHKESALTAHKIASFYTYLYPDNDIANRWKIREAVELCEKFANLYPKSLGGAQCSILAQHLKSTKFYIDIESAIIPNQPFIFKAGWKNINQIYYRIVASPFHFLDENKFNWEERKQMMISAKVIKNGELKFNNQGDFRKHSTEFVEEGLKVGQYLILASEDQNFGKSAGLYYADFSVSRLSFIKRTNPKKGGTDLFVLDRQSGLPLKGVQINLYYSDYNYNKNVLISKIQTDENGYAHYKNNKEGYLSLVFKKENDSLFQAREYNYRNYNDAISRTVTQVNFFTDRAIYRPGQTVYFKGIVLDRNDKSVKINPDFQSNVVLKDANYQEISSQNVKTNAYGSFSGSFTIPQSGITGIYQIMSSNGAIQFSVEEYKRPQFEVLINPIKGSFKLNDTVNVAGDAISFAGANLTNAKVTYSVQRKQYIPYDRYFYRSYLPPSANTAAEIAQGTIYTDKSGHFNFDFIAKAVKSNYPSSFIYTIDVSVTDINGETQTSSSSVTIGDVSYKISINLDSEIEASKLESLTVAATNFSMEKVEATYSLKLEKLQQPTAFYKERYWEMADSIALDKGTFQKMFPHWAYSAKDLAVEDWKVEKTIIKKNGEANSPLNLDVKNLESGYYAIHIEATNQEKEKAKLTEYIVIYNQSDKSPAKSEYFWVKNLSPTAKVGEKAKFLIASKAKNVKVLYEIEIDGQLNKQEWISLNNEQKIIEIDVSEAHRGGFTVHLAMVHDNRKYISKMPFHVPFNNKQLDVKLSTYRNKTEPGSKENWTLTVKDIEGSAVQAEILASMYDESLDQFKSNLWSFNPHSLNYSRLYWYADNYFKAVYSQAMDIANNYYGNYPNRNYYQLNFFGFENQYGSYRYRNARMMTMDESSGVAYETVAMAAPVADEDSKSDKLAPAQSKENTTSANQNENVPKNTSIRSDFRETAFFYPHLESNKDGTVDFSFSMPDALSRYKFMALAHTIDLKVGTTLEKIVAQKELMIVPNPPRFFREKDTLIFSAKISNLSDKKQSVNTTIEFFDALAMKEIEILIQSSKNQQIEVDAKGNSVVKWKIAIPFGLQAVTYRIKAESETHVDGEEKTLPVLTNRMLLTESLALPMRGEGNKNFTFDKLKNNTSSSLVHENFVIEYTSNPAWYAIQALPYLMEYPYECAEQTFSRLYANSIATHISNSVPKIKRVFEIWRDYQPDALLSNLEKNQELKALVIEETPWLRNAKNESERKRRLGELFQLDKMRNELLNSLNKLQKMQYANGSWPWFEGMPESRYISQYIVSGFGHLYHLNVLDRNDENYHQMMSKAVVYLDNKLREDYDYLIEHKLKLEDKHLNSFQIQYFYARSFFKEIPISKNNQIAFNYYYNQAKKYWLDYDLQLRGMIALAAQRNNDKPIATTIIKAAKDIAINDEEMGMYWNKNTVGYSWNQAPIETQALMIEAFDEVLNDAESVENLKIWLLKQKQTQDWKTTKATAEACYALLLKGTDILSTENSVKIEVGDKILDPKNDKSIKTEAGTGYFKKSWDGAEVRSSMGNIKVTKSNQGVAWGAAYWQYFEDIDKITAANSPLSMQKEMFIEEISPSGKKLKKIDNSRPIKVGDKLIVRIILKSDRDLEYVHLKDMRASGMEPINVISSYKYQDGLGYYESTRDAATNFFIAYLPKGTYVFEYPLRANNSGNYSNGISQIQCMYAPEFTAHSKGERIVIE